MPSQSDVLNLLKNGEGPKVEFKESGFIRENNGKNIAKTLASIANYEGGVLLIGVSDMGEIEGMEANKKDEEKIMNICADQCQPPIDPTFSIVEFDEGCVYYLNVLKAIDTPIRTNHGWFIRHGTTIRIMHYDDFKKFSASENILIADESEVIDVDNILLEENKKNILVECGKETPYLESKSSKMRAECIIYANTFNRFYGKTYYLETSISHITIDELKEIIKIYYSIFRYNHHISAFCINQDTRSWFGYGPLNFIKALEMQDYRYSELKKNQNYIHHREVASFIDELNDTIFYIHSQPRSKKTKDEEVTSDYVDIGFVFNKIPYGNKFMEFFEKIGSIPQFIDEINEDLTVSKKLNHSIKEKGYVVDEKLGGWVCGIFGDNSEETNIAEIYYDKIIVNFNQQHEKEDMCNYKISSVQATTLPATDFPVVIVNYKGDWKLK